MLSTTDFLLRHSIASAVSGVTDSTPSATGGPLSFVLGPPAVSASRSRACELLELLDDMAWATAAAPAEAGTCLCSRARLLVAG